MFIKELLAILVKCTCVNICEIQFLLLFLITEFTRGIRKVEMPNKMINLVD